MSFDFQFTAEEEAFRGELRQFLSAELPADHWRLQNDREPALEGQQAFNDAFRKKLAARGLADDALAGGVRRDGRGAYAAADLQ